MIEPDKRKAIFLLHQGGMSIRAIARRLGVSRNSVRQIIQQNGAMPDDPRIHKYLLAYASDFNFLPTALQPHGASFAQPEIQMATIDHSMWFHKDFRLDDWILYAIDSPVACGARGLVRGQFFNRDGVLIASTAQEGVIRNHCKR